MVDARADQYALGIIAWECLNGRPPFRGSIVEVGRAHLQKPLPALGPAFSPEIDEERTLLLRQRVSLALQDEEPLGGATGLRFGARAVAAPGLRGEHGDAGDADRRAGR